MHTRQKRVLQKKFNKAEKERLEHRRCIKKLRKTIAELSEKNQELEDRMEELEEETAELLKEKELLEDDDAADQYHMDLEDDDPSDHDEDDGEEPVDAPLLPSEEEEEDPEERVFGSGTDTDAGGVPSAQ